MIKPTTFEQLDLDRLERGYAYTSCARVVSGIGTPEDVVLFINEGTKPTYISLLMIGMSQSSDVEWEISANPVVTNQGTAAVALNRNTYHAADPIYAAGARLYKSPTVTSPGTLIDSPQTTKSSRFYSSDLRAIIAPTVSCLLRRISGGTNGKDIIVRIDWTEG